MGGNVAFLPLETLLMEINYTRNRIELLQASTYTTNTLTCLAYSADPVAAVVLLDSVVEKLARTDAYSLRDRSAGLQLPNRPMRRRIGIKRDDARRTIVLHRLAEECFRGSNVTPFISAS